MIINGLASDQSQQTIQLDFAGNAGIGSTTPGTSTSWNDLSAEDDINVVAVQGIRYASSQTDPSILCG